LSIKLKLDGFEQLLKEIQKAEGNVDKATEKCLRKSADIMQDTLKSEMTRSNVDGGLINAMPPPEIENDYGLITARVGYKKGAYYPDNLSNGYKVLFLNYGTPHRKKHGKIIARGFIQRAKRKAKKPIQQQQENTLKEILKGLK